MEIIVVIGSNMVDFVIYVVCMFVWSEMLEVLNFEFGCGGKGVN